MSDTAKRAEELLAGNYFHNGEDDIIRDILAENKRLEAVYKMKHDDWLDFCEGFKIQANCIFAQEYEIARYKAIIKEAIKIVRNKKAKQKSKNEFYKVAQSFNNLHTHTGDNLWMCPLCHNVHKSVQSDFEALTGKHYPACCQFPEDHRLYYQDHATTGNTKKIKQK